MSGVSRNRRELIETTQRPLESSEWQNWKQWYIGKQFASLSLLWLFPGNGSEEHPVHPPPQNSQDVNTTELVWETLWVIHSLTEKNPQAFTKINKDIKTRNGIFACNYHPHKLNHIKWYAQIWMWQFSSTKQMVCKISLGLEYQPYNSIQLYHHSYLLIKHN